MIIKSNKVLWEIGFINFGSIIKHSNEYWILTSINKEDKVVIVKLSDGISTSLDASSKVEVVEYYTLTIDD